MTVMFLKNHKTASAPLAGEHFRRDRRGRRCGWGPADTHILIHALNDNLSKIHVWPIDLEVCRRLKELDFRSDPADELIAETSLVHRVPLLTRDGVIKKSRLVPLAWVRRCCQ